MRSVRCVKISRSISRKICPRAFSGTCINLGNNKPASQIRSHMHWYMIQNAIIYIWIDAYAFYFLGPQPIQRKKEKEKNGIINNTNSPWVFPWSERTCHKWMLSLYTAVAYMFKWLMINQMDIYVKQWCWNFYQELYIEGERPRKMPAFNCNCLHKCCF